MRINNRRLIAFLWMAGGFLALSGGLMLVVPKRLININLFNSQITVMIFGGMFLLAGISLLSLGILVPLRAEETLRKANQILEDRVKERTQQLQNELLERQRVEDALTRSERGFRSLVENVPDGLIRFDKDLEPVYLSPAGERISRLALEAINRQEVSEGDISRTMSSIEKTLCHQIFSSGKDAVLEFSVTTADGQRHYETRYVPEIADSGEVESVLAIWRDVTGRKWVEDALRTSEERFRVALSHAGIWVFSQDCDLRYTWMYNPPAPLKREAYHNKTDGDLFNVEDVQTLTKIKRQVLQSRTGVRQEIHLEFLDGVRYFDLVVEPVYKEEGRVAGILCSAVDVTEREKLIQANEEQQRRLSVQNELLRSQTELMQAIFEGDPGSIAVLSGKDLVFQFVNPSYRNLLPHPEVDPVGRNYAEIWPPEENFRGNWLFQRLMETGKSFQMDWYPQEYPDGTVRYFSLTSNRIPWGDQPALLLVLWETTRLEEALRNLERAADEARMRAEEAEKGRRLLHAMMRYIPEGIAIADIETGDIHLISAHGSKMIGLQNTEDPENSPVSNSGIVIPIDKHLDFWQLYHLDKQTRAVMEESPLYLAVYKGQVVVNQEWYLKLSDGSWISILCNAAPLVSRDDHILGGLLSWRDITEIKQAEESLADYAMQLERSNKELQEFAFVASHDLQEPLRKIQAFGDRIKASAGDALDEQTLDFLDRMQSAAARMRKMIEDLLSLSRITTRGRHFVAVDLNDVVKDVLSDLEIHIERTKAEVIIETLPTLEADPSQMRQLFQNLIGNALKFRKDNVAPEIKVDSNITEGKAVLWVKDNGIGFDMQHLQRIFLPFQRLHGRNQIEGVGMGLAICRRIVERHGGTITAQSEPGYGATFIVKLPLLQDQPLDLGDQGH